MSKNNSIVKFQFLDVCKNKKKIIFWINDLEKYIQKDGHEDLQVYLSFLNVVIEVLGEHNHFENLCSAI